MAEETIVLSDTSPVIGLAAVGCFEVLRGLCGAVHITESVRKEVTARKHLPGAAETMRESEVAGSGYPGALGELQRDHRKGRPVFEVAFCNLKRSPPRAAEDGGIFPSY